MGLSGVAVSVILVIVGVGVAVQVTVGLAVAEVVEVTSGVIVRGTGVEGIGEGVGTEAGPEQLFARITSRIRRIATPIPMGIAYLRSLGGRAARVAMGVTAGGSPVYPRAVSR